MKITDSTGDSFAPMMMEFAEEKEGGVNVANPRLLHLVRMTGWPQYMNQSFMLQGKYFKDSDGQWNQYRRDQVQNSTSGWYPRDGWA